MFCSATLHCCFVRAPLRSWKDHTYCSAQNLIHHLGNKMKTFNSWEFSSFVVSYLLPYILCLEENRLFLKCIQVRVEPSFSLSQRRKEILVLVSRNLNGLCLGGFVCFFFSGSFILDIINTERIFPRRILTFSLDWQE